MKKLILILMLLPCLLGAMNIMVQDVDQSHAEACSTYIQTYCPTANIYIYINRGMTGEPMPPNVAEAINNNIDIISQSTTGLIDNWNSSNAYSAGIGVVNAHGGNSHIEFGNPSYLGHIVAVGCGTDGVNTGSYGYGLEFFVNGQIYESYATAIVSGMIAQLMIDHQWTFMQARQALRQTASNWETGWVPDGGFGYIDYASADTLETSNLYKINCVNNVETVNNWDRYIKIDWVDPLSLSWDISVAGYGADFDSTVTSSIYEKAHEVNDIITFFIVPDSGRVESYSKITTSVNAYVLTGNTTTIRPDGDVWSSATIDTPPFWSDIDEEILNTGDRIQSEINSNDNQYRFSLTDIGDIGTINSVNIYAVVSNDDASSSYYKIKPYISSTIYDGIDATAAITEQLLLYEMSVNPATSSAWTYTEINDLQIYVNLYGEYDTGNVYLYQLYVEIDYTAAAPSGWTGKISGVENASTINGVAVENIKSVMGVE